MAQLYMIEIFVDSVTIFAKPKEDFKSKKLIVKVRFGPTRQFIIKERELVASDVVVNDVIGISDGKQTYRRSIKVGKSFLFPSYPETMFQTLKTYPLQIDVWNNDKKEKEIFVGVGYMEWHTDFFFMIKETFDSCKHVEPLTIKRVTSLQAECCCVKCGEATLIVRLTPLGNSIVTEFQQLMKEPDKFVFRTDKAPSIFECQRVDGHPDYGPTRPVIQPEEPVEEEVCTNIQPCGVTVNKDAKEIGKYPIDKIRMGEIKGPCGNLDCPLAQRVRRYIRNLDSYKNATIGKNLSGKTHVTSNICGKCVCKDDRWHNELCLDTTKGKNICRNCGGYVSFDMTCNAVKNDEKNKCQLKDPPKNVAYVISVTSVPNLNYNSQLNNEYVVQALSMRNYSHKSLTHIHQKSISAAQLKECSCSKLPQQNKIVPTLISDHQKDKNQFYNIENNPMVFATDRVDSKAQNICKEALDDVDCKCTPIIPQPFCKSVDCKCRVEAADKAARKSHKPYCPSYKHKDDCEITKSQQPEEEEDKNTKNDDNVTKEKLPFELPPVKLGPCMVIGRPCMTPDGFARMNKIANLKPLPPSYSKAGKICCTKELERVRSVLKEYMVNEKGNEFRCVNKFLKDSEKRCCDDENI